MFSYIKQKIKNRIIEWNSTPFEDKVEILLILILLMLITMFLTSFNAQRKQTPKMYYAVTYEEEASEEASSDYGIAPFALIIDEEVPPDRENVVHIALEPDLTNFNNYIDFVMPNMTILGERSMLKFNNKQNSLAMIGNDIASYLNNLNDDKLKPSGDDGVISVTKIYFVTHKDGVVMSQKVFDGTGGSYNNLYSFVNNTFNASGYTDSYYYVVLHNASYGTVVEPEPDPEPDEPVDPEPDEPSHEEGEVTLDAKTIENIDTIATNMRYIFIVIVLFMFISLLRRINL